MAGSKMAGLGFDWTLLATGSRHERHVSGDDNKFPMWQWVAFLADLPDRLSLSYHLFQPSIQPPSSWKETSRLGGARWWVLAFVPLASAIAVEVRSPAKAKERTSLIFCQTSSTYHQHRANRI